MPVLRPRWKPDNVAWTNFLDRSAVLLSPAAASRNDQRLTEGMRMPSGSRAGLEGHVGANDAGRVWRLKQRIDAYGASKILL